MVDSVPCALRSTPNACFGFFLRLFVPTSLFFARPKDIVAIAALAYMRNSEQACCAGGWGWV